MSEAVQLSPPVDLQLDWRRRTVGLSTGQRLHGPFDEQKVCFVEAGWVCRSRFMTDGARQIVELILPGEHDTVHPHPGARQDILTALSPAQVCTVALAEVQDRIRSSGAFAAEMAAAEMRRSAISDERLVSLGRRTSLARMCHTFCELLVRSGADLYASSPCPCPCPLSQAELADLLGLSTVHTFRLLQTLSQRGVAKLSRGTLTILDPALLVSIGEFSDAYLLSEAEGAGAERN